jgi:serine protease inhibitor ecotin
VNLLGDNIKTIKKDTETLTVADKEIRLKVNLEITKYLLVSCNQNSG